MYCLDTDVLIDYLRGDKKTIDALSYFYTHGIGIFTTFINLCELYKGVYISANKDKEEADINALLYTVRPLEMNQLSCIFVGKEWLRLQKAGKLTQILDLMIASVAVTNNLILLTRNKKHYENIDGLKLESI